MRRLFVERPNGQIKARGSGTEMTPTYGVGNALFRLCGGNLTGPIHTTPNTLRWL